MDDINNRIELIRKLEGMKRKEYRPALWYQ